MRPSTYYRHQVLFTPPPAFSLLTSIRLVILALGSSQPTEYKSFFLVLAMTVSVGLQVQLPWSLFWFVWMLLQCATTTFVNIPLIYLQPPLTSSLLRIVGIVQFLGLIPWLLYCCTIEQALPADRVHLRICAFH